MPNASSRKRNGNGRGLNAEFRIGHPPQSLKDLRGKAKERRPEGQPVSVVTPDGLEHVFQNAAVADRFKQAAGIPA
jgi:hypothetical protein